MVKTHRKAAARLLKVSVRTVDRYIASGKLSTEKEDSRIWLDKREILKLRRRQQVDTRDIELSIDNRGGRQVDTEEVGVDIVSTSNTEISANTKRKSASGVYKKLYEETHAELKTARERLEGANYRVGQLEAMVKESVPLLDHQRLLNKEKTHTFEREKNIKTLEGKMKKLVSKLKDEAMSKKVYLVALFIILLLQPLWLFLIQ